MESEQKLADVRAAFKEYERQLRDPILLAGLLLELLQNLQAAGGLSSAN